MTEAFRKPLGNQVFSGNTYKFPPRTLEKEMLKKQGVFFDGFSNPGKTRNSNSTDGLGASFDRSGDGHDTGLGSPSADECLTDEESTFLPSLVYLDDMDSSSQDKLQNFRIFSSGMEEQIEAKYREIMTDLTEGSGDKNAESNDEESVVTEELEKEFTHKMQNAGVSNRVSKTSVRPQNAGSVSDLESIKTEEYENRFQAMGTDQVTPHAHKAKDTLPADSDGDTVCSLDNAGNLTIKKKEDQHSLLPGVSKSILDPVVQRDTSKGIGNSKESQKSAGLDLGDDDDEKVMELTSARAKSESLGNKKRNPSVKRHPVTKKHVFAMSQVGSRKKLVAEKAGTKLAILNKVDLEVSLKLQQELARLQSEILSKIQMKQALAQTAARLQNLCTKRQQEVRLSEKYVKENKMKAESIRREVTLTEQKRNSVLTELRRLTAEVENQRLLLDELSHQETMQRMTAAHHEELEHSAQKEWLKEKLHLKSDISFLKKRCLELEKEKNDFIAEKTREYDTIKAEIQDQLRRNTQKSTKEVADIERMLHETSNRLQSAQTDATQKQQLNAQLKEQIVYLQQELEKQNQLRDQLLDENVRSLRTIIKEQETMLGTNQKKSREETERAVQEIRKEADQKLRQMERCYVDQLNTMNSELKSKDVDLRVLSDRVKEQDEWLADLMDRVKDETYHKFQMHLDEERDKWELNKKHELSAQMEAMKTEMTSKSKQLREELDRERTLSASYLQQLKDLKQGLEDARLRNHPIYQQNLEADRDFSSDLQMDRLKDQETAADKMRETVDKLREQIERLEMEKKLSLAKQNAAEKAEKKFLEDLNREYRVVCEILHKSKPDNTLRSLSPLKTNQADTRLAISTAMLNLKSSLVELGEKFSGQEREIENLKASVTRLNKQMRNKLLSLQGQFRKEKEEAIEMLHDRLVDKKHAVETGAEEDLKKALKEKDSQLQDVQRKWNIWKEQTMQALVKKCREEVNKEMERRLVERKCQDVLGSTPLTTDSEVETIVSESPIDLKLLSTNSTYIFSTQGQDKSNLTPEKQVPAAEAAQFQVKEKVGRTQQPPDALSASRASGGTQGISFATGYKHISGNLLTSPPVQDTVALYSGTKTSSSNAGGIAMNQPIVYQLQMQIDRVENGRKVAEERANQNEHLLNQKLVEMAQLQTVLRHQNKEFMQLQRAYSHLQKSNR